MVFVDASNGEESIELVNSSLETNFSNEAAEERKDIVEVLTIYCSLFVSFIIINIRWEFIITVAF